MEAGVSLQPSSPMALAWQTLGPTDELEDPFSSSFQNLERIYHGQKIPARGTQEYEVFLEEMFMSAERDMTLNL